MLTIEQQTAIKSLPQTRDIPRPTQPRRCYVLWTQAEKSLLRELRAEGLSLRVIGRELQRTQGAVSSQLRHG